MISTIDLSDLIFNCGLKFLIKSLECSYLLTFILVREVSLRLELLYLGEKISDLLLFGINDALTHFQLFCLGFDLEIVSLQELLLLE